MALVRVPAGLKRWMLNRSPPANNATPITNKILPMIDPVSEALTKACIARTDSGFCWASINAITAMISSAAFPNVAFSRPPTPSPRRSARCSVARPIQPAMGMMARAEATKIHVGVAQATCRMWAISSTIAKGKNNNSQFKPPRKIRFKGYAMYSRKVAGILAGMRETTLSHTCQAGKRCFDHRGNLTARTALAPIDEDAK